MSLITGPEPVGAISAPQSQTLCSRTSKTIFLLQKYVMFPLVYNLFQFKKYMECLCKMDLRRLKNATQ